MRITLICAALLTICCILLTISNNLSAALMADQISAVSVLPARDTIPGTPVPVSYTHLTLPTICSV